MCMYVYTYTYTYINIYVIIVKHSVAGVERRWLWAGLCARIGLHNLHKGCAFFLSCFFLLNIVDVCLAGLGFCILKFLGCRCWKMVCVTGAVCTFPLAPLVRYGGNCALLWPLNAAGLWSCPSWPLLLGIIRFFNLAIACPRWFFNVLWPLCNFTWPLAGEHMSIRAPPPILFCAFFAYSHKGSH